jgi:hypothetical protein
MKQQRVGLPAGSRLAHRNYRHPHVDGAMQKCRRPTQTPCSCHIAVVTAQQHGPPAAGPPTQNLVSQRLLPCLRPSSWGWAQQARMRAATKGVAAADATPLVSCVRSSLPLGLPQAPHNATWPTPQPSPAQPCTARAGGPAFAPYQRFSPSLSVPLARRVQCFSSQPGAHARRRPCRWALRRALRPRDNARGRLRGFNGSIP